MRTYTGGCFLNHLTYNWFQNNYTKKIVYKSFAIQNDVRKYVLSLVIVELGIGCEVSWNNADNIFY